MAERTLDELKELLPDATLETLDRIRILYLNSCEASQRGKKDDRYYWGTIAAGMARVLDLLHPGLVEGWKKES